jgi:hypothetical protein
MRNLAGKVMQDVGLRYTVSGVRANPSHNATTVTEEVAVQSGKGSAGKSELRGTVMRKEGVGVLQEGDQHKPMIDPKVV